MRRANWLILAAGVFAVLEIWLIALIGARVGVAATLLLLLAGAILGGWLMRREWALAIGSLSEVRDDPEQIGARITDAALVFLGASLLVFPGFISDAIGVLFLLPPTRGLSRWAATTVVRWLTRDVRAQMTIIDARLRSDTVVEGEVVDGERQQRRPRDDGEVISGEILP